MLSDRDYMRPGGPRYMSDEGSILKPLLWLNVIVFVVCQFGDFGSRFQDLLVLHPWYIRHGEIWRLGSYMFAHGGLFHILFNMWGLYLFGQLVERALGPRRFLNLYLCSGLLGGLAWMAANWSGEFYAKCLLNNGYITRMLGPVTANELGAILREADLTVYSVTGGVVGASGAVFGVMVAAAMTFPNVQMALLFPPVVMKLRTMVICYAVIEVWQSFDQSSSVAHLAHLGGALGGFLYMRRLSQGGSRGLWPSLTAWLGRLRRRWRARGFKVIPGGASGVSDSSVPYSAAAVDRVLEKLSREGYGALNDEEQEILRAASEQLKNRSSR